jgi:hypothetical protein
MGPEWKGIKKTLRYFYEDEKTGEKLIKGWRFK